MFVDDTLINCPSGNSFPLGPKTRERSPTKVEMLSLRRAVDTLGDEETKFEVIDTDVVLQYLGMPHLTVGIRTDFEWSVRPAGMSIANYLSDMFKFSRRSHCGHDTVSVQSGNEVPRAEDMAQSYSTSVESFPKNMDKSDDVAFIGENPPLLKKIEVEGISPIIVTSQLADPGVSGSQ